jgi:F-type H+-transporting ATPase subunit delta
MTQAMASSRTTEITKLFNRHLIRKGRENLLHEITEAFIEQYKEYKGIHTVTLITAIPASEEIKNAIISRIKRDGQIKHVELNCIVQENIIGGFILEGKSRRIDASVAYDLTKVKNRFLTNEFIYRFR